MGGVGSEIEDSERSSVDIGNTLDIVLTTVRPRFAARFDFAPHESFGRN